MGAASAVMAVSTKLEMARKNDRVLNMTVRSDLVAKLRHKALQ